MTETSPLKLIAEAAASHAPPKFAVGDGVALKSGGWHMIVTGVTGPMCTVMFSEDDGAAIWAWYRKTVHEDLLDSRVADEDLNCIPQNDCKPGAVVQLKLFDFSVSGATIVEYFEEPDKVAVCWRGARIVDLDDESFVSPSEIRDHGFYELTLPRVCLQPDREYMSEDEVKAIVEANKQAGRDQ